MRLGEVSDCLGREWRQRQPHARCTRSEFAEHLPQRVEAAQLGLAIAHQQQQRAMRPADPPAAAHRASRHPPSAHPLAPGSTAPRLELSHQRCGNIERSRLGLHELLELAARANGYVDEGPERTGREQCFAGAPEDAGRRSSQKRRSSAVLPTPASPPMSTTHPCERRCTVSMHSPSFSSSSPRSSSSLDGSTVVGAIGRAMTSHTGPVGPAVQPTQTGAGASSGSAHARTDLGALVARCRAVCLVAAAA